MYIKDTTGYIALITSLFLLPFISHILLFSVLTHTSAHEHIRTNTFLHDFILDYKTEGMQILVTSLPLPSSHPPPHPAIRVVRQTSQEKLQPLQLLQPSQPLTFHDLAVGKDNHHLVCSAGHVDAGPVPLGLELHAGDRRCKQVYHRLQWTGSVQASQQLSGRSWNEVSTMYSVLLYLHTYTHRSCTLHLSTCPNNRYTDLPIAYRNCNFIFVIILLIFLSRPDADWQFRCNFENEISPTPMCALTNCFIPCRRDVHIHVPVHETTNHRHRLVQERRQDCGVGGPRSSPTLSRGTDDETQEISLHTAGVLLSPPSHLHFTPYLLSSRRSARSVPRYPFFKSKT